MKRTGEIVLTVVGLVLYSFWTLISFALMWVQDNLDVIEETLYDAEFTETEVNDLMVMMDSIPSGGIMLMLSLLPIIAGIVAIIFLKGNENPKAAGIILIVISVLFVVITFGGGIFSGLFYLIAGIMALVRKPKTLLEE